MSQFLNDKQIAEQICDAITVIVDQSIKQAKYDRTIQGTIVTCIDETIGKYTVKYQDSTFYAYATSTDIRYSDGSLVYILVPNNDLGAEKTILGTAEKLGINYVSTVDDIDYYEIIGKNCIEYPTNTFGLCSYRKNKYVKVLYSKDFAESSNLIKLKKEDLNQYLVQSDNLICGAVIKTELPAEQQFKGNYGIIFALDFLDNTTKERVTRYYTVDIDSIRGNPYRILTDTRQYGIFPIDGKNFVEVNYISVFCYGFPNSKEDKDCINDIFIKDFELQGSVRIDDKQVDGVLMSFVTKKGIYFDRTFSADDELSIEALIKVKGKVADAETQKIPFYWFIEHAGVTFDNTYYNSYGGQGWKCLNEYNIIQNTEDEQDLVEWIPAKSILTLKKKDVIAKDNRYKCVAIYNGTVIEKIITISNLDSEYDITIDSDSGTQFYFDSGTPTLTCYVNGKEELSKDYTYSWGVTNYNNVFSSLTGQNTPEEYVGLVVDRNVVRSINVNTITNFNTYQCTVYKSDVYLGTAFIKIFNSLNNDNLTYSLVINNGSEVYKYNENGVSPASPTLTAPMTIKQLSFTVFDKSGNAIKDDIIKYADIRWEIPIRDTLLSVSDLNHEDYEENSETGIGVYRNALTLTYTIDDIYDAASTNNTIRLYIVYNGINLSAETDLTFLKEGEPGSNGTEFVCKIVPNINSNEFPNYPIITQSGNTTLWNLNYAPNPAMTFFKVQLWRNGVNIFTGTQSGVSQEGKQCTVSWSILQNRYNSTLYDRSSFTVNAATGSFGSYKGYDIGTDQTKVGSKAAIIKVEVAYEGLVYFATLPFIERRIVNKNLFDIELKERAGFKFATYASDGTKPKYDNTNPFEVIVKKYQSGSWIDVSLNSAITYTWNINGYVLDNVKSDVETWTASGNLVDHTQKGGNSPDPKNVFRIRPSDTYDGYCVTNGVECIVKENNTEVGRIHIPVHLLLNRYSNANLNGWDGNNVDVNGEGRYILAPQVGAGKKESNNSFTGVVIGTVKESGKSGDETGLFGYSSGQRSIFLDAKTGKAEFGTSDTGTLIIDPTTREAIIKSKSYSDTGSNKGGMRINFTDPEIKFGTGNFLVNNLGHITAKGGGSIAGWQIDDTQIRASNKSIILDSNLKAIYSNSKNTATSTARGFYLDQNDFVLGSKIRIDSDGTMEIGLGAANRSSSPRWTITGNDSSTGSRSYISHGYDVYKGEIPPRIAETIGTNPSASYRANSVYIGTDGIAVGPNIRLRSSDGKLYSKGAELSEIHISGGEIKNTDLNGEVTTTIADLKVTDQKLQSVYSTTTDKYSIEGTTLEGQNIIYGYGAPPGPKNEYLPNNYSGYYYIDQQTGYWYRSNGSSWGNRSANPLKYTSNILKTNIKQTDERITATASDIRKEIDGEVETLNGRIDITARQLSSIYTQTNEKYDVSPLSGKTLVYGYGSPPDSAAYPPKNNGGKYYVDQSTGRVYYCNGSNWSAYSFKVNNQNTNTLTKVTSNLQSSIEQNAKNITLKVSSSDYNGKKIASLINVNDESIIIEAKHLDLKGVTTFASDAAAEAQSNVINMLKGGTTTVNGNCIHSGTILLGGAGNGNGKLTVSDTNNSVKVVLDNTGITAVSGNIGNWAVNTYGLFYSGGTNKTVGLMTDPGTDVIIYAGSAGYSDSQTNNAYFRVLKDGSLYATKATITGAITATSGSFTGAVTATSGSFNGKITASSGNIGGFEILDHRLRTKNGNIYTTMQDGTLTFAFAAGSENENNFSSAPFRVQHSGKLVATNASLKGQVIASDLQVRGTFKLKSGSKYYEGYSGTLTLGDRKVKFVKGIIVSSASKENEVADPGNPNAPWEIT